MLKKFGAILATTIMILPAATVQAGEFMDAGWAKQACDAWNKSSVLTTQLVNTEGEDGSGYSWVKNNAGRGYKLIQMYRSNCGPEGKVQLQIAEQNGKAMCVYGGKPDGKKLNMSVDYVMHATDQNWNCMGKGSWGCGAMGAMMSGKLKFSGPKMEAMKVMTPFESFLRLAGSLPGNQGACPAK